MQQRVLFANEPFLRKMLASFFGFNIPLYIEKIRRKNYARFWRWYLKHTRQSSQNHFFHYIQHDFNPQLPGLSKDQANMFKSLVSN